MTETVDNGEAIINDLAESVNDGIPNYDRYSFIANNSIKFRKKSINEWIDATKLPEIKEKMSIDELEEFNHKFLNINEIIMSNLAFARSGFNTAKLHYSSKILKAKTDIIREIHEWNNTNSNKPRRVPGSEILEEQAKHRCIEVYSAFQLAEMFYEFWQIMHDKLKLIDNRLTGMNILRNVESRLRN